MELVSTHRCEAERWTGTAESRGSSEMPKLLKGGKNSDVVECDVKGRVLFGRFVLCVPIPLLLVYAKKFFEIW